LSRARGSLGLRAVAMPPHTDHARWFAEEVQPHEAALRGYLHQQFPSVEADDVVQESYLKLWRGRAKVESAKAYFFTIARNTALTLFRRRRIFSDVPVSELPEWRTADATPDAATVLDAQQRLELAVEALDRLPARCREICVLAALERMSVVEIAVRLGLAESTVYVQLARGVKQCAHYLRERGEAR
jgi:RNA polymerase sigma factor (sigma-70 family)